MDHRSDPLKERSVLEYSFDFAFPGDEFGHKTAVLVGGEDEWTCLGGGGDSCEGLSRAVHVGQGFGLLAEAGDMEGRIIIKSDQEPAVKRLVKDLVEARAEGKSVVEESLCWQQWKQRSGGKNRAGSGRADQGDLACARGEVRCDGGGD